MWILIIGLIVLTAIAMAVGYFSSISETMKKDSKEDRKR